MSNRPPYNRTEPPLDYSPSRSRRPGRQEEDVHLEREQSPRDRRGHPGRQEEGVRLEREQSPRDRRDGNRGYRESSEDFDDRRITRRESDRDRDRDRRDERFRRNDVDDDYDDRRFVRRESDRYHRNDRDDRRRKNTENPYNDYDDRRIVLRESDREKPYGDLRDDRGNRHDDRNLESRDIHRDGDNPLSRNNSIQSRYRETESRRSDRPERQPSDKIYRRTERIPEDEEIDSDTLRQGRYREPDKVRPRGRPGRYDDNTEGDLYYTGTDENRRNPNRTQHVRQPSQDSFREQAPRGQPEVYPARKPTTPLSKSSDILRRQSDRIIKVLPELSPRQLGRPQRERIDEGSSSGWQETSFNSGYEDRNRLIGASKAAGRPGGYNVNSVFEEDEVDQTRYRPGASEWEEYPLRSGRPSENYLSPVPENTGGNWSIYPDTGEAVTDFRAPDVRQNGFLLGQSQSNSHLARPTRIQPRTHKNSEVRALEELDAAIHIGESKYGGYPVGGGSKNGSSKFPETFSVYQPEGGRSLRSLDRHNGFSNEPWPLPVNAYETSDSRSKKSADQSSKLMIGSIFMLLVASTFIVFDMVVDSYLNYKVGNWTCEVNTPLEDRFNFTIPATVTDFCDARKNTIDLLFRIFFGIGPVISLLQIIHIFVIIFGRINSPRFKWLHGLGELQIAICFKEIPQVLIVLFMSYSCACGDESKLLTTMALASGFVSCVLRYVTAYPSYGGQYGCLNLWWRCLCCKEKSEDIKDYDVRGKERFSCDVPCTTCCLTLRMQDSGCRARCWCYEFMKYLPCFCASCESDKRQFGLRITTFFGLFLLLCALVAQIVILILLN